VRTINARTYSDRVNNAVAHDQPTSTPTISVVIPTLNEAGNLPYVLNTIPRWIDEIIIVDGRSRDDTERVARVLRPDVRIVQQTQRGKGAAIRVGFEAAKGDILIVMDADGSMNGADIGAFRDALLSGADYVKGSRFCKGGGSVDITRLRRFGDRGICLLIRLLFGAHYSDGTYGFKAVWADRLDRIRIDTDGFEVELLIDIRAHRAGLRIAEVPCFETNRIHGTSNLNAARDGLRCLRVILRERLRRYHAAAA
jgi:glycosyltransferase involved in cell wall biosynthesis